MKAVGTEAPGKRCKFGMLGGIFQRVVARRERLGELTHQQFGGAGGFAGAAIAEAERNAGEFAGWGSAQGLLLGGGGEFDGIQPTARLGVIVMGARIPVKPDRRTVRAILKDNVGLKQNRGRLVRIHGRRGVLWFCTSQGGA